MYVCWHIAKHKNKLSWAINYHTCKENCEFHEQRSFPVFAKRKLKDGRFYCGQVCTKCGQVWVENQHKSEPCPWVGRSTILLVLENCEFREHRFFLQFLQRGNWKMIKKARFYCGQVCPKCGQVCVENQHKQNLVQGKQPWVAIHCATYCHTLHMRFCRWDFAYFILHIGTYCILNIAYCTLHI